MSFGVGGYSGRALAFVLPVLLFIASPALAAVQSSNYTCVSASLSESNVTIGVVSNGVQNVTTTTQVRPCAFGCNSVTGVCNDQSSDAALPIIVGSLIVAFIFAFLSTKMSEEFKFLQSLMVFISLALMVGAAGLMREQAATQSLGGNTTGLLDQQTMVVVYALYIAIAYYVVIFLYGVFKNMSRNNRAMRGRRVQL